ncbi:hypothetical protein [Prosthecobacter sp.]|uniref:hypothetical protein n=1 Tax=Prosthecobacter sp. TaxID=1965333 RepID=UPI001D1AA60B|nr:hypothetical protein [Prosthecobacter sp.]MCB1277373.1 hypothetical protein [Prosthecobacter sp.]
MKGHSTFNIVIGCFGACFGFLWCIVSFGFIGDAGFSWSNIGKGILQLSLVLGPLILACALYAWSGVLLWDDTTPRLKKALYRLAGTILLIFVWNMALLIMLFRDHSPLLHEPVSYLPVLILIALCVQWCFLQVCHHRRRINPAIPSSCHVQGQHDATPRRAVYSLRN